LFYWCELEFDELQIEDAVVLDAGLAVVYYEVSRPFSPIPARLSPSTVDAIWAVGATVWRACPTLSSIA
jgi:hypothetical protein